MSSTPDGGAGPSGLGEFERVMQLPGLVPSPQVPRAGQPSGSGDGPGRLVEPRETPSPARKTHASAAVEGSGGLEDPGPGGRDGAGSGSSSGSGSGELTKVFHGKGSFPLNLANMLESAASLNMTHVVSWLPCGRSFAIYDVDQFLAIMLPKFFKTNKNTKIRSFYRKLNRWGFSIKRNHPNDFTKRPIGPMKGVWHHPNFYRGRAAECLKLALETGNKCSFLSVTHSTGPKGDEDARMEDDMMPSASFAGSVADTVGTAHWESAGSSSGGGGGNEGLSSPRKTNAGPVSLQLREGNSAGHSGMQFYAGVRDGDGGPDQKNNADIFSAQAVLQALGSLTSQSSAAVAAEYGGLSNSFAAGSAVAGSAGAAAGLNLFGPAGSFAYQYQPTTTAGGHRPDLFAAASATGMQGDVGAGPTSAQGRRGTEFCNDILSSTYQRPSKPASAAAGGNRGRQAASWTAGAFSQSDINFPPAPFEFRSNNNASVQGGQVQNQVLNSNDNANVRGKSVSSKYPSQNQQTSHGEIPQEDVDLAIFFEKFEESLQ